MAKKTEPTKKTASPAPAKPAGKPAAKSKPLAAKPAAAKPVVAKAGPAKTKPAAKTPKAPATPAKPKALAYTQEDVALRAYFIAEKRQAHGLPGDEHQDWIEAERQLAEESKPPKKTRKA